jgi:hypothetical protein
MNFGHMRVVAEPPMHKNFARGSNGFGIRKTYPMKTTFLHTLPVSLAFLFAFNPQPNWAAEPLVGATTRSAAIVIVPSLEKPKHVRKLEEKDFGGYLMVYFKDQTHCAYMAVSRDGYTFTDINGGEPVFDGKLLAEQKGVRDPHIARGPDGGFYLAMTDLHVNGQRAGFRTTQWERPEPEFGWGNNRALVMMKSYDLIHWTHSDFRLDKAFPELSEIGCCWAPETIFDDARNKMMIYFTMKIGRGVDSLYYAYTDDAFTKMETKPELLFKFPAPDGSLTEAVRNSLHVIDGDITKVGNKFHLFYSSKETGTPGIEHSVSDKINQDYPLSQKRVDPETVSCEAPNVFKRVGTSSYVLMYDAYGAGNMGFSETGDFVTFKDLGRFNEGAIKGTNFNHPKHGAVTYLTTDELKAIAEYWKLNLNLN